MLRQKSLGSSIMVSDCLVEGNGYLEDENGSALLYLETNKDGYFNNDMFIKQVKVAIDINFLIECFPTQPVFFCLIMLPVTKSTHLMFSAPPT